MDIREKLIELLNTALGDADITRYELLLIADYLCDNGVTVQKWKPLNEPPKETGHYLVNIHQEDDERGEAADFVLDAWYQKNGLLFVPDTAGWMLMNEWHGLTEQMRPFITHWMPLPEPPKEGE